MALPKLYKKDTKKSLLPLWKPETRKTEKSCYWQLFSSVLCIKERKKVMKAFTILLSFYTNLANEVAMFYSWFS